MGASTPKRRPPTTDEGRENRLISLAIDLAEKQLENGTASSQVITTLLKLATGREKLERAKLENENLVLSAKVDHMASTRRIEQLYEEAMEAMKTYSGQNGSDYED